MQETWVQSLGQEDPCRREWLPTPVLLPGEVAKSWTQLSDQHFTFLMTSQIWDFGIEAQGTIGYCW